MRIVDLKSFLRLPPGTVFQKYEPCILGSLEIKGESIRDIDFYSVDTSSVWPVGCEDSGEWMDKLDAMLADGHSAPLDLETETRDGLFEAGQMFAVWEADDIATLIRRLSDAP